MFEQFSYDEYHELLNIVSSGRKNLTFSDFRNSEIPARFFILRHDVDRSLSAATKMAQFEAERGVRATYFLLLSSDHYNLLSENSCHVPQQLVALGHEVGLHYDVRAMSKRGNIDIERWLRHELDILSGLTGNVIHSIAMHNPSISGDDPFAGHKRFLNAYDPKFTNLVAYYSDSCGAWRDHAYNAFKSSRIPDKIQLLVHPFFWAAKPGDRWERLNHWMDEKIRSLASHKQKVLELWDGHAGVKEHQNRLKGRIT